MNERPNAQVFRGECHCGELKFEATATPEVLVDCNCTLCRRISPLWGHMHKSDFRVIRDESTIEYVQGDRTLTLHTCSKCGCTTHWEGIAPASDGVGVNFRMCEPEVLGLFRIRKFDGADTWKFID